MEKKMKKPLFVFWLTIGILLLAYSTPSLITLILSLVSIIGLVLNKKWSKYSILCLSLLISLSWIYIVIAVSSKVFVSESMGEIIISLIPGVLLLALCFSCTVIVFRYFKKI
jgi:hypothetical protein